VGESGEREVGASQWVRVVADKQNGNRQQSAFKPGLLVQIAFQGRGIDAYAASSPLPSLP
jgi:hypothetical protein